MAVRQSWSGTQDSHRGSSSVCTVKENGLDHAGEDLGNMNAHDLRDHLWEVDMRLQSLRLYEQVVGELVQLPHNLEDEERDGREEDVVLWIRLG